LYFPANNSLISNFVPIEIRSGNAKNTESKAQLDDIASIFQLDIQSYRPSTAANGDILYDTLPCKLRKISHHIDWLGTIYCLSDKGLEPNVLMNQILHRGSLYKTSRQNPRNENSIVGPVLLLRGRKKQYLYKLLRPELCEKYAIPLSSDAFSPFEKSVGAGSDILNYAVEKDEEEVSGATNYMLSVALEDVKMEMKQNKSHEYNSFAIRKIMHDHGVNMRHLGLLRSMFDDKKDPQAERIRRNLLKEMTLRAIKNYIRNTVRDIQLKTGGFENNATDNMLSTVNFFKSNIADIFNEIFSATSQTADFFWKHKIRTLIFLKYGERASPLSEEENQSSMDLRHILGFKNSNSTTYVYDLLFELPKFTGFSIKNEKKLRIYSKDPMELGEIPFCASDFDLNSCNIIDGLSKTYAKILRNICNLCLEEKKHNLTEDETPEQISSELIAIAFGENSPEHLLSIQECVLRRLNYDNVHPTTGSTDGKDIKFNDLELEKWEEIHDWASNRTYWCHKEKEEITWDIPDVIKQAREQKNASRTYTEQNSDRITCWKTLEEALQQISNVEFFPREIAIVALYFSALAQCEYCQLTNSNDNIKNFEENVLDLSVCALNQITHALSSGFNETDSSSELSSLQCDLLRIITKICKDVTGTVWNAKNKEWVFETRHEISQLSKPITDDPDRETILSSTLFIILWEREVQVRVQTRREWQLYGIYRDKSSNKLKVWSNFDLFATQKSYIYKRLILRRARKAGVRVYKVSGNFAKLSISHKDIDRYVSWAQLSASTLRFDHTVAKFQHVFAKNDEAISTTAVQSTRVWSCGDHWMESGVMGLGRIWDSNIPLQIKTLNTYNIVSVATGMSSSYAVTKEGWLFHWGNYTKRYIVFINQPLLRIQKQ
jgi:hypothetical protein